MRRRILEIVAAALVLIGVACMAYSLGNASGFDACYDMRHPSKPVRFVSR